MIRSLVGWIGARFIYALIWIFGRTHRRTEIAWLVGPLGDAKIGDAPYRDVAQREDLELVRDAPDGGLVPNFDVVDPDRRAHALVREFYEHTTRFAMDVWSQTFFPARIGLWLLVTTISRQVNQLNFPLTPLETAHGLASEIILLRRRDGSIRYTGWFRTLAEHARVLYTGFYMTEKPPREPAPCVKVVFPMPRGNATVVLRPSVRSDGSFELDSSGHSFGEAGFYRVQARDEARLRVWRIATLREHFHVFVDDAGTLRCDHDVSFLGLRVLRLHYKMFRRDPSARSGSAEAA